MEHLLLKAAITATDEGVFEAVMSTKTEDREKDVVEPAAVVAAINSWNRPLPLSWNHSTKAADIFGSINEGSARELNAIDVAIAGEVDLESGVGKDAWRSFKRKTIGFSYGYMPLEWADRPGGGKHITKLDIFEVTATPTPMNNGTRVLSAKSAEPDVVQELQEVKARLDTLEKALEDQKNTVDEADKETKSRSVDPLRQQADALALEVSSGGVSLRPQPKRPEPPPAPDLMDLKELRQHSRDLMLQVLSGMEEAA